MARTRANRPCNDDYTALKETYRRLRDEHPGKGITYGDAIAFMQYAATSQLNANFVSFISDYQTANDMLY